MKRYVGCFLVKSFVLRMKRRCGISRVGSQNASPVELVEWEQMGEADESFWIACNVKRMDNNELVSMGVFRGK